MVSIGQKIMDVRGHNTVHPVACCWLGSRSLRFRSDTQDYFSEFLSKS